MKRVSGIDLRGPCDPGFGSSKLPVIDQRTSV